MDKLNPRRKELWTCNCNFHLIFCLTSFNHGFIGVPTRHICNSFSTIIKRANMLYIHVHVIVHSYYKDNALKLCLRRWNYNFINETSPTKLLYHQKKCLHYTLIKANIPHCDDRKLVCWPFLVKNMSLILCF